MRFVKFSYTVQTTIEFTADEVSNVDRAVDRLFWRLCAC